MPSPQAVIRTALVVTTLVAAVLALVACETNSVALTGRAPAASLEASRLRTIAVLDLGGYDGDAFASLLRAELQGASIDGRRWFTLVSDDAMLADAGLGHGWRPRRSREDVRVALQAARAAGVDAVYLGEVVSSDVSGASYDEEHSRCTEWDGLFDCETREKYWTVCHSVAAIYAVGLEVVDVRTGAVALADSFESRASDRFCDDESRWTDPGTLLTQARAGVLSQIRHAVAPSNVTLHAEFKPKAPGLGEPAEAAFQNGVAFAREGRMDRACEIWRGLAPGEAPWETTSSAPLLQNLGVCAEAHGDHARAAVLYAAAEAALPRPDDDVSRARRRVADQALALQLTR